MFEFNYDNTGLDLQIWVPGDLIARERKISIKLCESVDGKVEDESRRERQRLWRWLEVDSELFTIL